MDLKSDSGHTHFRGEGKQTSNPEGPGSHRHVSLPGVLAQGLSEKWGGNWALPVWRALKVTWPFFNAQDQGSVRQVSEV